MAKSVQKFVCGICGSEYGTEGLANNCEMQGNDPVTEQYKIGDEVEFTREQQGTGSHQTFFKDKGKVIHKFQSYNEKQNKHVGILMLACKDDEGVDIERSAFMVKVNDDPEQLFSASTEQFKVGFTEALIKAKAEQ